MRRTLAMVATICASFAQGAEDWQSTCVDRAKLALSLTLKWKEDQDSLEFKKIAASCSLKLIRDAAVKSLVFKENLATELQDQYEEFEYSNNAIELNRTLCKLLEKVGPDAPTTMESVRLLSSQNESTRKKALASLQNAPAETMAKFNELKDVDYKRSFAEQMKLLEWAETQRLTEFDVNKVDKERLERFTYSGWILAHPLYDELSVTQSMEILYGVLILRGENAHKGLALADLTFQIDLDELWNEPDLKISTEMKILKEEFWSVRGIQFWEVLKPWMAKNHSYLYFHPKEKRFRIDYAARKKGMSSKDYRSTNKWGKNEGPNIIDPKKSSDYRDD